MEQCRFIYISETNVNAAINLQASSQVVITKQPESVNAATGKQFILKVEAEGTNLKYKWQAQKTESGEWTDFRDTTQSLTRTMSSIYDGSPHWVVEFRNSFLVFMEMMTGALI